MSNNTQGEIRPRLPKWLLPFLPALKAMSPDDLSERLDGVGHPGEEYYYSKDEKAGEIIVDTYSSELLTPEDQANFHKIDLTLFEAGRVVTNYYQSQAKVKINGREEVTKTGLHQLKVFWRRKVSDDLASIRNELKSQIIKFAPKTPKRQGFAVLSNRQKVVEICVSDLHLGKAGFDPETMEFNWSLAECGRVYESVIKDVVQKVGPKNIERFILPTGNDFLNIDSSHNATHKGTPQMAPEFWGTMFRYAKEMTIAQIEYLSTIAPVEVVFVPGNHDKDSIFSLGEAISAYFQGTGNPNVKIINKVVKRVYVEFGECAIGYTHGDGIKAKDIHKCFTLDRPDLAHKKFKALHIGHLHKNKKTGLVQLDYKDENGGIEIEVCPSLSPTDRWHYQNLYIGNLRRSKSFIWDKEKGLESEVYFNL